MVVEGVGQLPVVVSGTVDLECLPVRLRRPRDTRPPADPRHRFESFRPPVGLAVGQRQHGRRSPATLVEVASGLPESPGGERQPPGQVGLRGPDRPIQRRADVVVVPGDPVEPQVPVTAFEVVRCLFCQTDVGEEVTPTDGLLLAEIGEACGGELANHVQHPEPRVAGSVHRHDEALVDERGQAVENGYRQAGCAHLLDLLEAPSAGEHRQPSEQEAFRLREEVVAPPDRRFDRSLPFGEIDRPSRQHHRVETIQDRLDG